MTEPTRPHPPPVALDQLIANVSGSEALAAMIVDEFLAHVDVQLAEVERAVGSGDGARIHEAAHRHQGSLAAIHAAPALAVASAIASAGHRGDARRARVLLGLLRALSVELVGYLRTWRARQPARPEPVP